MRSDAAGPDNEVRHLPKVHVHPFKMRTFVYNYRFSNQLLQKHELSSHGLEGCLCTGGVGSTAEFQFKTCGSSPPKAACPCRAHVSQPRLQEPGQDGVGIIKQPGVSTEVSPAGLHGPSSLCPLLTR